MTPAERIAAIAADPNASFWLKLAAHGLAQRRNPLAAERDAMQLLILARALRHETHVAQPKGV